MLNGGAGKNEIECVPVDDERVGGSLICLFIQLIALALFALWPCLNIVLIHVSNYVR